MLEFSSCPRTFGLGISIARRGDDVGIPPRLARWQPRSYAQAHRRPLRGLCARALGQRGRVDLSRRPHSHGRSAVAGRRGPAGRPVQPARPDRVPRDQAQETIADAYERSLEAEAILHELQLDSNACQTCRRPVEQDFNVCPYCKTLLREPCKSCARPIRTNWMACPFCAADRAPVRVPQLAPQRVARAAAASAPDPTTPPADAMKPPARPVQAAQAGNAQTTTPRRPPVSPPTGP